jgi:hypothetical protein
MATKIFIIEDEPSIIKLVQHNLKVLEEKVI